MLPLIDDKFAAPIKHFQAFFTFFGVLELEPNFLDGSPGKH
jgi:hypothetical protein